LCEDDGQHAERKNLEQALHSHAPAYSRVGSGAVESGVVKKCAGQRSECKMQNAKFKMHIQD
jgi:hypothetical protein